VAAVLDSLAQLLKETNRLAEAERLMRRALTIHEKSFGTDHRSVAVSLNNLGWLLQSANRPDEAEPLIRRALAIDEKSLGLHHSNVSLLLNNLAWLAADRGDWFNALAFFRRAHPIVTRHEYQTATDRADVSKGTQQASGAMNQFRGHVVAAFEAARADPAGREEGFQIAQLALPTDASVALFQMAVRSSAGPLSALMRARQDLIGARKVADKRLLVAVGGNDTAAAHRLQAEITRIDTTLDGIDLHLQKEFP